MSRPTTCFSWERQSSKHQERREKRNTVTKPGVTTTLSPSLCVKGLLSHGCIQKQVVGPEDMARLGRSWVVVVRKEPLPENNWRLGWVPPWEGLGYVPVSFYAVPHGIPSSARTNPVWVLENHTEGEVNPCSYRRTRAS